MKYYIPLKLKPINFSLKNLHKEKVTQKYEITKKISC